ncbi:hypothetical protein ACQVP2_06335 [Methylobacterium aquaticum]|uniref:hypothetical protein n=1 Tax=Methylobacterium aquaticum TaxID=270351 RepID=UPI003D182462
MMNLVPSPGRDGTVESQGQHPQQTGEPVRARLCVLSMPKPRDLKAENIGSIAQRSEYSSVVR